MLELSEPYHGALQWWEKPFEIFRKQEGRHLRLFPHDKLALRWLGCSSANRQKGQLRKNEERRAPQNRTPWRDTRKSRATPVLAADTFSPNCVEAQEPLEQVPRG